MPICAALVLGSWQLVYTLGVMPEKYFPSIRAIAGASRAMLKDGAVLSARSGTIGCATVGLIGAAVLVVALRGVALRGVALRGGGTGDHR